MPISSNIVETQCKYLPISFHLPSRSAVVLGNKMDMIPGTYNFVVVEYFIDPNLDLTKKKLRRLVGRPNHGGQWDTMVEITVKEEFPRGTGPFLCYPFLVSDEGEVTDKSKRFATKMAFLLNKEKREECLSMMVTKMVTPLSGAQEYLIKRIAREGALLAEEARREGHKVLHIEVHVDIAYCEVDLDNLP